MANDVEAQALLDDLLATLKQLAKAGVPVKISDDAHGKPAVWVGLGGCRFERGAFTFDSAAVMGMG
jgi:hypothetical protein